MRNNYLIKEFLQKKDSKELLKQNNIQTLYELFDNTVDLSVHDLTEFLLDNNINPLNYFSTSIYRACFSGINFSDFNIFNDITIPDNIQYIKSSAFARTSIEKLITGESLMAICSNAFYGSTSLHYIDFSKSTNLREIKSCAFEATNLDQIILPASIEAIANSSFEPSVKVKIPKQCQQKFDPEWFSFKIEWI